MALASGICSFKCQIIVLNSLVYSDFRINFKISPNVRDICKSPFTAPQKSRLRAVYNVRSGYSKWSNSLEDQLFEASVQTEQTAAQYTACVCVCVCGFPRQTAACEESRVRSAEIAFVRFPRYSCYACLSASCPAHAQIQLWLQSACLTPSATHSSVDALRKSHRRCYCLETAGIAASQVPKSRMGQRKV